MNSTPPHPFTPLKNGVQRLKARSWGDSWRWISTCDGMIGVWVLLLFFGFSEHAVAQFDEFKRELSYNEVELQAIQNNVELTDTITRHINGIDWYLDWDRTDKLKLTAGQELSEVIGKLENMGFKYLEPINTFSSSYELETLLARTMTSAERECRELLLKSHYYLRDEVSEGDDIEYSIFKFRIRAWVENDVCHAVLAKYSPIRKVKIANAKNK